MKRRIYLASSWRNELQPEFVRILREAGHEVYDFRHPSVQGPPAAPDAGFGWESVDPERRMYESAEAYREALRHPLAQEGFWADLRAMEWADTFVMLQPCGRSAHLELGWATGRDKDCWVVAQDGQEPELMVLTIGSADRVVLDSDELVTMLAATSPPSPRRTVDAINLEALATELREVKVDTVLSGDHLVLTAIGRLQGYKQHPAAPLVALADVKAAIEEVDEEYEYEPAANSALASLEKVVDALARHGGPPQDDIPFDPPGYTVIVRREPMGPGFQAHAELKPERWARGDTAAQAVGELVYSWPDIFGGVVLKDQLVMPFMRVWHDGDTSWVAATDHDDLRRVHAEAGMSEDDWLPDGDINVWVALPDDRLLNVGFEDHPTEVPSGATVREVDDDSHFRWRMTATCSQWAARARRTGHRFIASTEW